MSVIGWDIGGVNTKVARVAGGEVLAAGSRPYEVQRDPAALAPLLRELARTVGANAGDAHAVTMTAELSQMFRTKREGVAFVLDAVLAAFPSTLVKVYAVDGRFLEVEEACQDPVAVSAANWAATARAVAGRHRDALLVDIGTTTTDIIPIVDGVVVAAGLTDPARLMSGELVYTGVLRTPTEAITSHVPLHGATAGVSAEAFALAGDVHVWRGDLAPVDYTVPTPDGRPATREFAGERLARVVCADRELLDASAISVIADALASAQVARIATAMARLVARHPSLVTAIVTGLGAFLGERAALAAGLRPVALAAEFGEPAARSAPAVSVALLLEAALHRGRSPLAGHRLRASEPANDSLTPGSGLQAPGKSLEEALPEAGSLEADVNVFTGSSGSGKISQKRDRPEARSPEPEADFVARSSDRPSDGLKPVEYTQTKTALNGHPHVTGRTVDTVVKLGGGVLAHATHFDAVLAAISEAARHRALLVVPGGGPFADLVREVDGRLNLTDDAAHWMAVLAMDQYAYLVAERLAGGMLVTTVWEIACALDAGRIPVLAPSRWMREADPLPHSWDVTSDSIAAWVAGAVGAPRLLVKPPSATGDVLDAYFSRALPADVTPVIVPADRIDAIHLALDEPRSS